jgi:hypothetical protein
VAYLARFCTCVLLTCALVAATTESGSLVLTYAISFLLCFGNQMRRDPTANSPPRLTGEDRILLPLARYSMTHLTIPHLRRVVIVASGHLASRLAELA